MNTAFIFLKFLITINNILLMFLFTLVLCCIDAHTRAHTAWMTQEKCFWIIFFNVVGYDMKEKNLKRFDDELKTEENGRKTIKFIWFIVYVWVILRCFVRFFFYYNFWSWMNVTIVDRKLQHSKLFSTTFSSALLLSKGIRTQNGVTDTLNIWISLSISYLYA